MTSDSREYPAPEPHGTETGAERRFEHVPFRLFVESVLDYAIFMLDPDGYVVSWNAGAERIKGYTADEIVGQHFSTFYTEPDIARDHPAHELAVARTVGRYEEEGWRRRKDGTRFWANVVITAVRDHDGRLVGFGKVTRDLTERKLQEEREHELLQERTRRAEAEAANRAKAQFLATMSHELRTPLNAIVGYLDLLELEVQGPLSPAQITTVQRIRRSAQLLLSLINDVLNFARLEAGGVEYHLQDTPLKPLVAEVEMLMLPQLQAKGVTYARGVCDGDLIVHADPEKLQQILLNLLTNAHKFTESGGRIWLTCERQSDSVTIRLHDTGRGIPQDRLEHIFEPFVQVSRHLSQDSQQGVGLGLAISRDLARAMGGDLSAESELGHGSTFTLTVPLAN